MWLQVEVHPDVVLRLFGDALLELIPEAKIWCTENMRGPVSLSYVRQSEVGAERVMATFTDDVDALMFRMRWAAGADEEDG